MSRPDVVPVLDADPELAERLPREEFEAAREALVARVIVVEQGSWEPLKAVGQPDQPAMGLLVLDGLLSRQVGIGGRPTTELLGAGDLLRPWDDDSDVGIPLSVHWQALQRTRLAVLDHRFLGAVARWPAIIDALTARTVRRSRWLSFQLATKQIMRVEGRLLILLWALSERWGVVTPRGVDVRLKLTHEMLGKLVGARRPSVTTAIGALTAAGEIERTADGYRLLGDPQDALERVDGYTGEAAAA